MIQHLQKDVKEGFAGVHKRQDEANGQIGKNTAFRNKIIGALAVVGFLGVTSFVGLILMWLKVFS